MYTSVCFVTQIHWRRFALASRGVFFGLALSAHTTYVVGCYQEITYLFSVSPSTPYGVVYPIIIICGFNSARP